MPKYTFLAERITVYASLTGERFDSQEKAKRESHIHMILEVMASIEEEILKSSTEEEILRSETLSRGMAKKLLDFGIVDEFTLEKKYREEMDRRQKEEDEEDVSIEEDSDVNKETEGFEGKDSGVDTGEFPRDEGTDV